ncbi:serine hydrolase domain-containing protein [Xanthobacter sp. V3C-3]|uniref:serine hydrolase domain-containing protein n=1 Tax=Xanthobacter lutulentifluminis TaxID=3119935 RepID=UPI00372A23DA
MKPLFARLAALGLAACVAASCGSGARAMESLDSYLAQVRARYGLPALAAAVARNGEIIAAGAVGTRVAGKDIPVTLEDRFHLGSDTKALTATVAGTLVDEGKIKWTTTLGEVLGKKVQGINPALAAVTLEQLLDHTSGIPSDTPEIIDIYFNPVEFQKGPTDLRLDALERWKAHAPQVPKEGSPFQYANLGYIFAGAMLEEVSGQSWEQLVRERIYEPLGLKTAGFGPQATFGRYDAPFGHSIDDKGVVTPIGWGSAADIPAVTGPAGIAHMSVLDFARWADWNAGGGKRGPAIVKPETLAEIHRPRVKTPPFKDPPPGTPAAGEYAFGWGIVAFDWARAPVLTHNGSNSMNLAKVLVEPVSQLSVVVVTNYPEQQAEKAAREVQQHLYEMFRDRR